MRCFCFNKIDLILRKPPLMLRARLRGRLEGWASAAIHDSEY